MVLLVVLLLISALGDRHGQSRVQKALTLSHRDSRTCLAKATTIAAFECSEERRAPCKGEGDTVDRGCSPDQTRCDFKMYHQSSAQTGDWIPCCEKQNLWELLKYVDTALCGKVEYSLFYGSLLASIRDKNMIDWDTDVDLVVHEEDREKVTSILKDSHGHYTFNANETSDGTRQDMARVYFSKKNHVHVDIFFAEGVGDCTNIKNEVFPTQWLTKPFRGDCEIQGYKIPCLTHSEKVLNYLYGGGRDGQRSWRKVEAHGKSDSNRAIADSQPHVCLHGEQCTVEANGFTCGPAPPPPPTPSSAIETAADSLRR